MTGVATSGPGGRPCCSWDAAGLEHCHGTLLVHDDGTSDCDVDCLGVAVLHRVVVHCDEVGGCCVRAEAAAARAG